MVRRFDHIKTFQLKVIAMAYQRLSTDCMSSGDDNLSTLSRLAQQFVDDLASFVVEEWGRFPNNGDQLLQHSILLSRRLRRPDGLMIGLTELGRYLETERPGEASEVAADCKVRSLSGAVAVCVPVVAVSVIIGSVLKKKI